MHLGFKNAVERVRFDDDYDATTQRSAKNCLTKLINIFRVKCSNFNEASDLLIKSTKRTPLKRVPNVLSKLNELQ